MTSEQRKVVDDALIRLMREVNRSRTEATQGGYVIPSAEEAMSQGREALALLRGAKP